MIAARERTVVRPGSKPSLPKHVRIQFDPVRGAYAVLAPEKVFWPNDVSLDILRRCDGLTEVSDIVRDLAAEYDAPADEVTGDVTAFLQEWADNLLVRL